MAKRRERPATNPLLKDRVAAIVAPREPDTNSAVEHTSPTEPAAAENARQPAAEAEGSAEEGERSPIGPVPRRKRETKVQIKARVSKSEAEEMERLTRTLSSYLGAKVNGSHVTRALWTLAIRSQEEFAAVIDRRSPLERPSNGDPLGMAQFEDAIADLLSRAIRRQ